METAQADLDHAESGTNEQAPRETEWASSRACSMDDGCGVAASSHDWLGPAWKAVSALTCVSCMFHGCPLVSILIFAQKWRACQSLVLTCQHAILRYE
eukprot:SAG31_NODE_291_length_18308_cov_6.463013_3_plen_98_part_00